MESLLGRLTRLDSADELLHVLTHVRASLISILDSPDLKKFEAALVQQCCQDKNLAHWKNVSEHKTRWENLEHLYGVLSDLCRYDRSEA